MQLGAPRLGDFLERVLATSEGPHPYPMALDAVRAVSAAGHSSSVSSLRRATRLQRNRQFGTVPPMRGAYI
jgi:hypothetical protein